MRQSTPSRWPCWVALLLAAQLSAGCDLWPRNNPRDPSACDPRCGAAEACVQGRCVAAESGATDGGPDLDGPPPTDGPLDAPHDGGTDLAVDTGADALDAQPPDATQPTPCKTGWSAMTSGVSANLQAVWGRGSDDLYAVGDSGTVVHFDGSSWSDLSAKTGSTAALYGVWGTSTGPDLYAVGAAGTILHYDGVKWAKMSSGTTETLLAVSGRSKSNIWAVGKKGTVRRFDGTSWKAVTKLTQDVNAVWAGPSKVHVGVNSGSWPQWTYTYSNSQWYEYPGTRLVKGLWGVSDSDVWAAGDDLFSSISSGLWRFDGKSWKYHSNPGSKRLWGICGAGGTVYAVGDQGSVLIYDGSSWIQLVTGTLSNLRGVWAGPGGAFAVGTGGAIYRYRLPWTPMTHPKPQYLEAVWGSGPGDVFAVGEGPNSSGSNNVLHFDGTAWKASTGGPHFMEAIWGSGTSDVYIIGHGVSSMPTYFYRFDGMSWKPNYTHNGNLSDVWGRGPKEIWATGSSTIHFNGTSWKVETTGANNLMALWGPPSPGKAVFAVGGNGAIVRYDGTKWSTMTSGTTQLLWAVWGSGPSDVIAVGNAGTILRYNGTKWSAMSSGTSEKLMDVWGSGPKDYFAVGTKGTALHYDGSSWKPTKTSSSADLRGVWGSNPYDVYAVGKSTILRWCGP